MLGVPIPRVRIAGIASKGLNGPLEGYVRAVMLVTTLCTCSRKKMGGRRSAKLHSGCVIHAMEEVDMTACCSSEHGIQHTPLDVMDTVRMDRGDCAFVSVVSLAGCVVLPTPVICLLVVERHERLSCMRRRISTQSGLR